MLNYKYVISQGEKPFFSSKQSEMIHKKMKRRIDQTKHIQAEREQRVLTFTLTTVMILSFRADVPRQTVQTQIRLLLEEQSDQGLHCLPLRLHSLDSLLYGRATQFKF